MTTLIGNLARVGAMTAALATDERCCFKFSRLEKPFTMENNADSMDHRYWYDPCQFNYGYGLLV